MCSYQLHITQGGGLFLHTTFCAHSSVYSLYKCRSGLTSIVLIWVVCVRAISIFLSAQKYTLAPLFSRQILSSPLLACKKYLRELSSVLVWIFCCRRSLVSWAVSRWSTPVTWKTWTCKIQDLSGQGRVDFVGRLKWLTKFNHDQLRLENWYYSYAMYL